MEHIEKNAKITVEGDKASATLEGHKQPQQLVKKGDVWLITPPFPVIEDKEQQKQMIGMLQAMVKAREGPRAKIGKEAGTATAVMDEANAAIAKILGGPAEPGPGPGPKEPPKKTP